jgi:hypothetical protein
MISVESVLTNDSSKSRYIFFSAAKRMKAFRNRTYSAGYGDQSSSSQCAANKTERFCLSFAAPFLILP